MATSEVEICNVAIGRIGSQNFIESLQDPYSEARVCKRFYSTALKRVLEDFPWPFARKMVVLQDVGSPIAPWGYRYRYPVDCVQLRRLFPQGGTPHFGQLSKTRGIPHQVICDDDNDGKAILCDWEAPMGEYTALVTKVSLFTPAFENALAWMLASEIATPLSADPKYAQAAASTYARVLAEAGALAVSENQADREPECDLLAARNA